MMELGLGMLALGCAMVALGIGAGIGLRPAPADRLLADVRYRDGRCIRCGEYLDDESIAAGYETCGDDCENYVADGYGSGSARHEIGHDDV